MALQQNPKVRSKNPIQNLAEQADQPSQANPRGDLIIAQGLPANAELVRLANSYYTIQTTAAAPVAALPTTAGSIGIYNGEGQTGKVYVIDSVFASVVVSAGAAVNNMGLAVGIWSPIQAPAIPAASATVTTRGLSGRAYSGNGIIGTAITTPSGGWMPLGTSVIGSAAIADAGQAIDIPVNGTIIVLPGGLFAVSVLASIVATITCDAGFRWHEVLLPFN